MGGNGNKVLEESGWEVAERCKMGWTLEEVGTSPRTCACALITGAVCVPSDLSLSSYDGSNRSCDGPG